MMRRRSVIGIGLLVLLPSLLFGCRKTAPASSQAPVAVTATRTEHINHFEYTWFLSSDPESPLYDIYRVQTAHPEWGEYVGEGFDRFCASGARHSLILKKPGSDRQYEYGFYLREGKVLAVYQKMTKVRILGEKVPYHLIPPRNVTPADTSLPPYTVYADVQVFRTPERFGEVVVPSLTAKTPAAERERVARGIAKQEGFSALYLYHSAPGWRANQVQPLTSSALALLRKELIGKLYGEHFRAEPGLW